MRTIIKYIEKKTLVFSSVNFYALVSRIGAGSLWPVGGCRKRTIPRKTAWLRHFQGIVRIFTHGQAAGKRSGRNSSSAIRAAPAAFDDTIPPRRAKGNRPGRANMALNRAESNEKGCATGQFAREWPLQGVNRAVQTCAALARKRRFSGLSNGTFQSKCRKPVPLPIFKGWRFFNMAKL